MIDRPYLYYDLNFKKGDIIIIRGITTDYINIQKIGDITYKCLKDGVYTLKFSSIPKLYMIYNNKEILYIEYETIDDNTIKGYFLKGMKINDTIITKEGIQEISVQNPITINY